MFKKRNSLILSLAEHRYNALLSIDAQLDLGNGLSVSSFSTSIEQLRRKLGQYNTMKSSLDGMLEEIRTLENQLADQRELVLLAVATKFGKNSDEYVRAGGSRKLNRRSRTKPTSPDQMSVAGTGN